MGLAFSQLFRSSFGFFHDDDVRFFAQTALNRSKVAKLQRRMMKEKRRKIKHKRMVPIPPLSEMVQTSEEEIDNREGIEGEEGIIANDANPTTTQSKSTMDSKEIPTGGQPANPATEVPSSTPTVYTVDSPRSSDVSKKASPVERMKEREEQSDFLAVTASSLKTRSEQRRLGGSRRSSRGHSPSSARSLTGSIQAIPISDNLVGVHLPDIDIDECALQRKIDEIRLETILDNEEEYAPENNDPLNCSRNVCQRDDEALNDNNNNIEYDQDDCVFEAPIDVEIEKSSNTDVTNKISSTSYTLESMLCNNQDPESPERKTVANGDSYDQNPASDSELAPHVWSEVEIFALIEIPQRVEPLRIEYHRFGSTLDFSTCPAMDPTFSSNMTQEEISSLFEGDVDIAATKNGASYMLSLIPKLISKFEGFMIINGLEMRIVRTTRMELTDIRVENHVVVLEVVPKAIAEIELRRSPSRFEIEWRDEVAIHTTKWMTVAGQQEKVSQLKLTKSKETKSVLLLTIPL